MTTTLEPANGTKVATVDRTSELRSLVARIEQLLDVQVVPASVNPDGTPGAVASGELIESAWGNAVANTMQAIKLPNTIAGNGNPLGYLRVETGQVATVLDANGNVLVTYPGGAFASLYTVVVTNTKYPDAHVPSAVSITATGFTLSVKLTTTGAAAANAAISVNYIAIGRR